MMTQQLSAHSEAPPTHTTFSPAIDFHLAMHYIRA